MAVVESELDMLSGAMEKVAEQDIAPDTKILRMIYTHLDASRWWCSGTELCVPIFSVIYGEWRQCGRILTNGNKAL